jgi:archaellum component FlaC
MPTQEERLETLEDDLKQFKDETIKAYGEMAVEMTIVKGLTEDAVARLAALKDQIEHRFGRVDTRLDGIDAHLRSIDGRFARVATRLDGMDSRLSRLENLLMQVLGRLPEH